jgi:hypothetical protein
MKLFPSSWELYSHPFLWEKFSIPRNVLYPGIQFSKLVTNMCMHISILLFQGIYKYNLKQTHMILCEIIFFKYHVKYQYIHV